jgi:hypothetical protein
MNPRFEHVLDNYGFDPFATPQWLMVPLHDIKPLWLVDAKGLTVRSSAPRVAAVAVEPVPAADNRSILRVEGKAAGRALVEILQGQRVLKTLAVTVRRRVTLGLSFHFVSDSAKPVAHSTVRAPADLAVMLLELNRIYEPQTNITFTKKNHFLQKFDKDFGRAVSYKTDSQDRPLKGHEYSLVTSRRDAAAQINVYCVWENGLFYEDTRGKLNEVSALSYATRRNIMLGDWDGYEDRNRDGVADNNPEWENARMLAHEIGHILGIADVTKTRKPARTLRHAARVVVNPHYVMGSGPFIPKVHSDIMFAIAQQIVGT